MRLSFSSKPSRCKPKCQKMLTDRKRILPHLKAVDFFCGAGGMSFGLQAAQIEVLAGIDNAKDCRTTYEANIKGAKFIEADITTLSPDALSKQLNLRVNDDELIFAGCSPCQFWSKIRTDKTKALKTAFLLEHFKKFIFSLRPGFVVVENVPGIFRSKDATILDDFKNQLRSAGYVLDDGIINAAHYGVPQNRIRYLLIATRLIDAISLPKQDQIQPLAVSDFIGVSRGFSKIVAGHRDNSSFLHTSCALSSKNMRRIKKTPHSGGNRHAWKDDPELQIPAYIGKDDIFKDVYGRMSWDKPSPTITTRFISLSNGRFGHPDENRAISLREGACLQTFPKTFRFHGDSLNAVARQIGNAVPPTLAKKIGKHLKRAYNNGEV